MRKRSLGKQKKGVQKKLKTKTPNLFRKMRARPKATWGSFNSVRELVAKHSS